jgi:hypothetical protein
MLLFDLQLQSRPGRLDIYAGKVAQWSLGCPKNLFKKIGAFRMRSTRADERSARLDYHTA